MTQVREHWGSKLGFMMAAIGSAIGLGILWKFPYVVGENGGGLFLLCYLVCLILIAIPIFIAELILGRSAQKAAVSAFAYHEPKQTGWQIGAWLGVASSFLIMSYYSVIGGYGLSYILMSINGFYNGLSSSEVVAVYDKLSGSGPISTFWHFIFTAITAGIVYSGVRKGIEFWSKIMVKIFLLLLFALFLYSTTLSGFKEAFHFIIYPNVASFKASSALQALGLAFFTMSLGQGVMISYGSYMKKSDNVAQVASIVAISIIIVAALAALTIFPIVFSFGLKANSGPGLIFKTLPYLFAQLPGSMVLSTLFFVLFVFTGLTSAVPLIEVVAGNMAELTSLSKKKSVILVGCLTFLFGLPSAYSVSGGLFEQWPAIFSEDFLLTMDGLVSVWLIPLAGLVTALFVGWKIKREVLFEEFNSAKGMKTYFLIWRFGLRYIVPILILCIIAHSSGLVDFDQLFTGKM
ncbi:MAG: sodium-dependent transporter [Rhabdochlamydiaceae bacterium]|nr:sodium-dependent transporter [Candidatus Amphrikana amoebophyrae]